MTWTVACLVSVDEMTHEDDDVEKPPRPSHSLRTKAKSLSIPINSSTTQTKSCMYDR